MTSDCKRNFGDVLMEWIVIFTEWIEYYYGWQNAAHTKVNNSYTSIAWLSIDILKLYRLSVYLHTQLSYSPNMTKPNNNHCRHDHSGWDWQCEKGTAKVCRHDTNNHNMMNSRKRLTEISKIGQTPRDRNEEAFQAINKLVQNDELTLAKMYAAQRPSHPLDMATQRPVRTYQRPTEASQQERMVRQREYGTQHGQRKCAGLSAERTMRRCHRYEDGGEAPIFYGGTIPEVTVRGRMPRQYRNMTPEDIWYVNQVRERPDYKGLEGFANAVPLCAAGAVMGTGVLANSAARFMLNPRNAKAVGELAFGVGNDIYNHVTGADKEDTQNVFHNVGNGADYISAGTEIVGMLVKKKIPMLDAMGRFAGMFGTGAGVIGDTMDEGVGTALRNAFADYEYSKGAARVGGRKGKVLKGIRIPISQIKFL